RIATLGGAYSCLLFPSSALRFSSIPYLDTGHDRWLFQPPRVRDTGVATEDIAAVITPCLDCYILFVIHIPPLGDDFHYSAEAEGFRRFLAGLFADSSIGAGEEGRDFRGTFFIFSRFLNPSFLPVIPHKRCFCFAELTAGEFCHHRT